MQVTTRLDTFLSSRRNQYLILAAITLLAAALRFYKLGEWSFWYDEIFTLRDVRNLPNIGWLHQQLSRLLIYFVVHTLGESEWTARIIPALIGVLTIPILYFLVRKSFGVGVALFASIFLAIAPWHLYWSQNARFYTTLLLFYTLALFAFYYAIEEDRPWYLVLFLIFLGFAVLERLFSVLLIPVVVSYLLLLKVLPFEKPPGLRMRNIWIVAIPILMIVLLGAWQYISNPEKYLISFDRINNNPLWIVSGVIFYLTIPIMCMGFVGAVYYLIQKNRAVLLLAIAAIFPILAIVVLSAIQYTATRYAFVTLTSWIVLAALAVWTLLKEAKGFIWILSCGVILLLFLEPLSEAFLYYRYQNGNRDDFKSAVQFIDRYKEPGEKVVVTNALLANYYSNDATWNYLTLDLDNLPQDQGRIWFVEDNTLGDLHPETVKWLQENTNLIANFDVRVRARNFKMRVYRYDPDDH